MRVLPDIVWLLVNSVSRAAFSATVRNPKYVQDWRDELEGYVAREGKFSKFSVGYFPLSPPPAYWDYKCKKCFAWQQPNSCRWVEGTIMPFAWCAIWLPPESYKAFTWPKELLAGNW